VKTHTADPVPFAVRGAMFPLRGTELEHREAVRRHGRDGCRRLTEREVKKGTSGIIDGVDFLPMILKKAV
jgi:2,3-bisphosphoglycerate-independent phosphoglycerate mutase